MTNSDFRITGADGSAAGPITIALDTMGGDFGPPVTVPAALKGVAESKVAVALVGDPEAVQAELDRHDSPAKKMVMVVPSEGVVGETEPPAMAVRSKPRASVFVAAGVVKAGKAQAFVSMGSTGASMAAATVAYGRLQGIDRGALGGPIIGYAPNSVIIDLGTNVDTRPSQLVDFAALGGLMSKLIYGVENPRVAILSVGSEEGKGNALVKETTDLLRSTSMNFVGNIEADQLPGGAAEVVVCDGFVGNIVLKLTEGIGHAVIEQIKETLGDTPEAETLIRKVFEKTNTLEAFGGGPLFGLNGVAVVGHGRSGPNSIANAIATAKLVIEKNYVEAQAAELARFRTEMGSE